MKENCINKAIDSAAESAKETLDLMSDKLDAATQCGKERMEKVREHAKGAASEVRKAAEAAVGKDK